MRLKFIRRIFTSIHELSRNFLSIVDFLSWFLFDPSKFKKIKTNEINRILVVLINQEKGNVGGDFITLGVVNYFKKIYPNVKISFLSDYSTIKIFKNIQDIEFIKYKDKKLLKNLKNNNFKAALFFNFGPTKISDFLFIPYRVSFSPLSLGSFKKFYRNFFLTRKVYNKMDSHMIDLRFKMFEALGFKFKEKKPFLEFTEQEEKNADDFIRKNKIKKFIILHPGGKYVAESYKAGKWPPHLWNFERYAQVADHFLAKGYKIIITGSKDEEILAKEIIKYSKEKNKIISACGKLSIKEVGTLLKKTSLLIATDTAIVHIAYQDPINAKIVELMGPSLPEVVGAWPLNSPRHKILVDKGPCCRSMRKLPFKDNYNCLKNIKVEQVIKAGEELL
ncbi:MAG: glycosyltransferase family 9 protein [Nanoarchaeota archaeon]|nr:glycosyltransferase family 9 protein [Nanoarchaeota archaeon]